MRFVRPLVASLLAAYATVLLVSSSFLPALFDPSSRPPLGDFGSFYASGQAAAQGLDPYAVYPLTMNAARGRGQGAAVNLNPPFAVALFQPLSLLDPYRARSLWFAASFVAFVVVVALLHAAYAEGRSALCLSWAFAQAGLWETLNLGQVYALLTLPTTLAWLTLERRPVLAGILLGAAAAFKPNFLVWPALLLLVGYRRAFLASVAAALVCALLPVVLYGPGVYAQWLAAAAAEAPNPQVGNAAVAGILARLGVGNAWPLLAAIGLAVLAAWAWLRRPEAPAASAAALVGSLLFSPLAWVGYSMFLLPIFYSRTWTVPLAVAAALLVIPRLPLQEWAGANPVLGSAYAAAWLLVLFDVLRRAKVARP